MRAVVSMLAVVAMLCIGASAAQAATVANGDFETGDLTGWTVNSTTASTAGYWFAYTGTVAPLTGAALNSTIAAPPQGTYAALADQVNPGRRILYQDVALEQLAPGATMTLDLFAYYKAQQGPLATPSPATLDPNNPGANEQYRIDVMTATAALDSVAPADVLLNVFQTQTGDPQTLPPTQVTADLTPFAGQTVRLRFAEVDDSGVLNASTDDVRISIRPALSTTASLTGNQLVDSATLAGGAGLTGQITFNLFGPGDSTCTDPPIFSTTTPVSGSGVYPSAAFTPTQPGTYRWIAAYSGDSNNEAVAGACNDPGETVKVLRDLPVRLIPGAVLRAGARRVGVEVICPARFASCSNVAVRLIGRPDRGRGKGVLIASGKLGIITNPGHTKRARLKITRRGRELIANRDGTLNIFAITSSAQTKNARQLRTIRPR